MSWLSRHVKGLRKHVGMTQAQLAERIGVGETTIRNIESSYLEAPAIVILEAIAAAFGVTVESLTGAKPIELDERAKEVYVVNEVCNETKLPSWNNVTDVIYIDRDVLRGYDHIAVKVNDNAMLMEGIRCDAVALVRVNVPIKNSDIVLAMYEKKSIIRKYYSDGREILLRAANDSENYPDIRLDAQKDKSNIIGKVIKCEFYV